MSDLTREEKIEFCQNTIKDIQYLLKNRIYHKTGFKNIDKQNEMTVKADKYSLEIFKNELKRLESEKE